MFVSSSQVKRVFAKQNSCKMYNLNLLSQQGSTGSYKIIRICYQLQLSNVSIWTTLVEKDLSSSRSFTASIQLCYRGYQSQMKHFQFLKIQGVSLLGLNSQLRYFKASAASFFTLFLLFTKNFQVIARSKKDMLRISMNQYYMTKCRKPLLLVGVVGTLQIIIKKNTHTKKK